VAEPGEDVPLQSAEDLLEYLEGTHALAHSYVQLLLRAATEGYPVGVQEDTTWDAEALSDWEAAAWWYGGGRTLLSIHLSYHAFLEVHLMRFGV
jgi:hypothetical protein